MLPYTGGKPHQRHAILAINLKGGGGFEIWQYTSRKPELPVFQIQLGDLGLFCTKMKSDNAQALFEEFKQRKLNLIGQLHKDPAGNDTFFVRDPWDNLFQIVQGVDWFGRGKEYTGGPVGSMIGVSDLGKAKKFYGDILGYDSVVYDTEQVFPGLNGIPGGERKVRRVLMKHSVKRSGAFSQLLGSSEIELIHVEGYTARKIFENRFWGDRGFIHLCFDIYNMADLRVACEKAGHPFTVDSANSFDMGEAAGHFSYIEDPDGTLIEFVETHKIPILKKMGWYLDLRRRNPAKALPQWILKSLGLNRVK
jgi:catechol 2,3-dioxygenase-like lactoylglutathione lyase family enzyme